jgi:DNA-binding winged helix-turn-helix (wHTH) protein/tetratricopeptide (TPR) repeat protein
LPGPVTLHYEFDGFSLDPLRRTLAWNGAPLSLTPTLFKTLLFFAQNPGRIISKDELLRAVWPNKVVDEANVSQTIFTLRKALSAAGAQNQLIATVPGAGYRMVAPVLSVSAADGPASAALQAMHAGPPGTARIRRVLLSRGGLAASTALVVIGLGFGVWRWQASPVVSPGRRVVLVGDFQNLARDPQFDRTFAVATQIDLQQSPFLNVLPDQKIGDTLALMTRPKDAPLTPAVAREVCARNSGLATVQGTVAQVGAAYLLTVTAADCATGEVIEADKAEVPKKEDLLPALDKLLASIRQRLGETAESTSRFSTPMLQERTVSLAALQAYSQGHWDFKHGQRIEAVQLFQKAVKLDPRFAMAHVELAAAYNNLHEPALARDEVRTAYALRDTVGPRERLVILGEYNTDLTRDMLESLSILRSWTALYPNDAQAWANLSDRENWTGDFARAIADGRRAVALDPGTEGRYAVLARALMHAGKPAEAQAVCDAAIAHHVDGDDIHGILYQIAFARNDMAAAERQMLWAKDMPGERSMLLEAGQGAFRLGEVHRALALFGRAVELGKPVGLGNFVAAPSARLLNDMGLEDQARASLAQVPAGFDSGDYRFSLAELGDAALAEKLLKDDLTKTPTDTLLHSVYAPEERAALLLRQGQPRAAVAALEPARPYELRTADIPYLRGRAYLAAGDGTHAAAEFRKLLDHPGVEPVSVLYPLAELGLARAYRLAGDRRDSRTAYDAFLAAWRSADPGMPLIKQARAEQAAL